ncbi:MAG: twin-arginine translocase TatA/TatE family subunit [Acidobacteria bacterium]|jgi:TatA/E family protein of Tat protein translocase|nr:twin-arginine translocase TatA/TatE family subunit [Acidobacteriota bacterium]
MFGSIGFPELILVFIVVLLVFGPKKLPEFAKLLGKALREFRSTVDQAKSAIEDEIYKEGMAGHFKEIGQDVRDALNITGELGKDVKDALDITGGLGKDVKDALNIRQRISNDMKNALDIYGDIDKPEKTDAGKEDEKKGE